MNCVLRKEEVERKYDQQTLASSYQEEAEASVDRSSNLLLIIQQLTVLVSQKELLDEEEDGSVLRNRESWIINLRSVSF